MSGKVHQISAMRGRRHAVSLFDTAAWKNAPIAWKKNPRSCWRHSHCLLHTSFVEMTKSLGFSPVTSQKMTISFSKGTNEWWKSQLGIYTRSYNPTTFLLSEVHPTITTMTIESVESTSFRVLVFCALMWCYTQMRTIAMQSFVTLIVYWFYFDITISYLR